MRNPVHRVHFIPRLAAGAIFLFLLASHVVAREGNYLVLTAEAYENTDPLNQFIAAKTSQGFDVVVHTVTPDTSNTDIQSYIQGLWDGPDAPDYILIVGDTAGSNATSTTIPHWTGLASRQACTDLYYGCMDGGDDWYPDIPIGRFSVPTVARLQNMVNKSLYVEAGIFSDPDYTKRAAFLATSDLTSGAEQTHDWVIDNYMTPENFECTKIYALYGGYTNDVTNAVNNGCLFVVYGGHSAWNYWSEPYFSQNHVRDLTNRDMYGLVFGWSCDTAHYSYDACFGETWLRVPNRGAAAYLSASDLIFWGSWEAWEPSRQLEKYFFESFFVEAVWEVGPAWQIACYKMLADYGQWDGDHEHQPQANADVCRNFFEEFVLLGDPALLLPGGHGFRIISDPQALDLCCPPAEQAVYTLDIRQIGDFNEPVTLSAQGLPAGAGVSFSVNSIAPPFSTVMTISDIEGGSPGVYTIDITGVAGENERRAIVELALSTSAPGTVTLTSPVDGADDTSRRPTFTWEPVSQGVHYHIQVAADPAFENVVMEATADDATYTSSSKLDSGTLYYWCVRAQNSCGDGVFSSTFSFTTLAHTDYFTQQFEGSIDLSGRMVAFIPDGSGDYYTLCGGEAAEFPIDPNDGTVITPGEDAFVHVQLADAAVVSLYGVEYEDFYVNSSGNITFDAGSSIWWESLDAHFITPRISGLFDDFSPQNGGRVSWQQLADRVVVTYENVPEYSTYNDNTFQIEMFFDGEIHITWLNIDTDDCIVGLSEGTGLQDDFVETDLSAALPCGAVLVLEVDPLVSDVCVPDDAVYEIGVDTLEGYSEDVLLSVDGLPAGTSYEFSVNPVTPPGTSLLTISDTVAAKAGEYTIEIRGSCSIDELSTFQVLRIVDSTPVTVTLAEPPDGAEDVALLPLLSWEPAANAWSYDLEIATDSYFANVVYSTSTIKTSYLLDSDIGGAPRYFWHVRGVNACGNGSWSSTFSFTKIRKYVPVAYDMLNGESGTSTYHDDNYNGDGDNDVDLAPLSDGLGDLTDSVIAPQHWNMTPEPYVGWVTIDPTVTFHFQDDVDINSITLHLDDGGGGDVHAPADVTIVVGENTLVFPCTDPPGEEPFALVIEDLDLCGNTLELTIADYSTSGYMMLSEVEFLGRAPEPCYGDLNGDNIIGIADLAHLLANYGMTDGAEYYDGDLENDGDVDLADLACLLGCYGETCS